MNLYPIIFKFSQGILIFQGREEDITLNNYRDKINCRLKTFLRFIDKEIAAYLGNF